MEKAATKKEEEDKKVMLGVGPVWDMCTTLRSSFGGVGARLFCLIVRGKWLLLFLKTVVS